MTSFYFFFPLEHTFPDSFPDYFVNHHHISKDLVSIFFQLVVVGGGGGIFNYVFFSNKKHYIYCLFYLE